MYILVLASSSYYDCGRRVGWGCVVGGVAGGGRATITPHDRGCCGRWQAAGRRRGSEGGGGGRDDREKQASKQVSKRQVVSRS